MPFSLDTALLSMISVLVMKGNPTRDRLPKGKVYWQVIIDKKLHRKFKARCVEIGKTMTEQAEVLIRNWLKKAS